MPELNDVFAKTYDAYYDDVYKYLLVKTDSRAALQDLCQNVWLGFFQKLSRDGPDSVRDPKRYLLRSAKTQAAEYYRRSPRLESLDDTEREIVDERALDELERADSFSAGEIMDMVRQADGLTYKIFVLHFVYGYTLKKTAAELGLREAAVKSRLYRELKRLRRTLKEGMSHEGV